MKITDVKCAVFGRNPVVRVVTDEGISGYGSIEANKSHHKPVVGFYKDRIVGEDPTDVERVMLKIRRLGAFKPWGAAVSAIEMALWDIAGKAAGLPVHKLLGGKVRDRVRVYNGGVRTPMQGQTPEDQFLFRQIGFRGSVNVGTFSSEAGQQGLVGKFVEEEFVLKAGFYCFIDGLRV
jgi:L-alanine-DL-glutamate epimerase-like enolase superfamily enzyme